MLVDDPYRDWILSPGGRAVPGTIVSQLLDPESPEGKAAQRIYDLDLCRECGKRKAAITTGDALAISHDMCSRSCDICFYSAALAHAWNRVLALPKIVFILSRAHLLDKLPTTR